MVSNVYARYFSHLTSGDPLHKSIPVMAFKLGNITTDVEMTSPTTVMLRYRVVTACNGNPRLFLGFIGTVESIAWFMCKEEPGVVLDAQHHP